MNCEKCNKEHDGKYGSGRFCSRKCANSRIRSEETRKKIALNTTYHFVERVLFKCAHCKKEVIFKKSYLKLKKTGCCSKCFRLSKEYKKALKKGCSSNGGYRVGSGNGLRGIYQGFWCDSSWELAFVIYNIDHQISFERNNKPYVYEFEGRRRYYPDFIIDDVFYEIKGYHFPEATKAKLKYFPHKIVLIGKKEIKPYLEYVEQKYGKDFVRLYEVCPH